MSTLAADLEVICTIVMDPDGEEALYGEDDHFIKAAEYDIVQAEDYRAEGCTAVRHRLYREDAPFYTETDGDSDSCWEWPNMLSAEWLEVLP